MQIKTAEGMHNVTSQGQGTYNTIAGSAGLASFLGINAGNILGGNGCGNGGWFGGSRNNGECWETKEASCLREQISVLTSENFARQAATQAFTDAATLATTQNDKQAQNLKELYGVVIAQGQQISAINQEIACNKIIQAKDMELMRKDLEIEAERRCCADNSIVNYVNATFYPKEVASITTGTAVTPQDLFNPIPRCCPCK